MVLRMSTLTSALAWVAMVSSVRVNSVRAAWCDKVFMGLLFSFAGGWHGWLLQLACVDTLGGHAFYCTANDGWRKDFY